MKTLVSALAVASVAGSAFGMESAAYYGHLNINLRTGVQTWVDRGDTVDRVIDGLTAYSAVNNMDGTAPLTGLAAISSTDLTQSWGDNVNNALSGVMDEYTFSVFNSGSGVGSLSKFNLAANFFNGNTLAFIGGFTTLVDFSASVLPVGFFTYVTFTGISSLGINLPVGATFVRNDFSGVVGATRIGTTLINTPAAGNPLVGTSAAGFFIDASTVGAPGFYNVGTAPSNLQIEYKIPAPGAAALMGLAGLVGLRRRR